MELEDIYVSLREGAELLSRLNTAQKNTALAAVRDAVQSSSAEILAANARDVAAAREKGVPESLVDRLALSEARLDAICDSVGTIIGQTDPVGQVVSGWVMPAGMSVRQVRVPFGVAAIIYESRPNVTVDAFALAFKSGNAILLRGSSSALASNCALVASIKAGLAAAAKKLTALTAAGAVSGAGVADFSKLPDTVAIADSGKHEDVDNILTAVGKIDIVLPRGSARLIKMVTEKARVPVIETGSGICHLYIDDFAYAAQPEVEMEKAAAIAENAKLQRPGVCNAIECIVINRNALQSFVPVLVRKFAGRAQFRCDRESLPVFLAASGSESGSACAPETAVAVPATEADFDMEFLDRILAVKTVASLDEAVSFINAHNTKHSESIITQNTEHARIFQNRIDAACVYVNASTRFTDGGEFGFGAELGISTQKMHIRGPMGASALTTTKYLIEGEGQIR